MDDRDLILKIGKRIKEIRLSKPMTLEELAAASNMDNANIFNDMRNNADNEDGNIYTYVKGINSHLETILYEIDNEILYLKGKYTEKNVQNKYYKHIETKYIPIDTENN